MEMSQVRYFLALCKEQNFTRAARRCGVAQPSLTSRLNCLKWNWAGRFSFGKRSAPNRRSSAAMLSLTSQRSIAALMKSNGHRTVFRHVIADWPTIWRAGSACTDNRDVWIRRHSYPINGLMKPTTSLTRSACRLVPVFPKICCKCVFTVVSETPRTGATSGTPPI